ncbi:NAD(P)-binding domain-containing protein, partial [Pseudomonas sp. 100_A]|uniref:NAD(P)-binding domain-containing protein n=1 Tax=Pseudomonas sp. 100_A TaxID=2813571 RepID=UPI0034D1B823
MSAPAGPAAGGPAAVIGLGAMGSGMAASLLRAGFAVAGYDPDRHATERFAAAGGVAAASPAEAARGAGVVVAVVVNADQTEAVLFGPEGCAEAMAGDGVFVSSATMAPERARALAARLEATGRH